MRSGRFDLAADEQMVAAAVEEAETAGVPRARIDEVVTEELRLDDDFSHPIAAARLSHVARARRAHQPMPPAPWQAGHVEDW